MQKFHLLNLFLIVSFFLGGCDFLPFGIETEPNDPTTETASPSPEENAQEAEEEENQESQEIARSPVPSVSGLQQASDPEEFVRQRGEVPGQQRNDPFAFFPVSPETITRAEPEPEPQSTESPDTPEPETTEAPTPAPPPEPETTEAPTPAPPPKPELARGTQVQGALRIGNQTVAIIKAPNEPTSRHVRVGELIAQGQVLVKEIDINARPTPVVILEELGINQEVRKEITGEVAFGNSETTIGQNVASPLLPSPPLGDS